MDYSVTITTSSAAMASFTLICGVGIVVAFAAYKTLADPRWRFGKYREMAAKPKAGMVVGIFALVWSVYSAYGSQLDRFVGLQVKNGMISLYFPKKQVELAVDQVAEARFVRGNKSFHYIGISDYRGNEYLSHVCGNARCRDILSELKALGFPVRAEP